MSASAANAAITYEQLKPMEDQQPRPFWRALLAITTSHQPSAVRSHPAT